MYTHNVDLRSSAIALFSKKVIARGSEDELGQLDTHPEVADNVERGRMATIAPKIFLAQTHALAETNR